MPLLITPQAPTRAESGSRVWIDWFVKVVSLLTSTVNTLTTTTDTLTTTTATATAAAAAAAQTAAMTIPIIVTDTITNPLGVGTPYEITTASFNIPADGQLIMSGHLVQHDAAATTGWALEFFVDGVSIFGLSGNHHQPAVSYTTAYDVSAGNHTVKLKWTGTATGVIYNMSLVVTRIIT